MRDVKLGIRYGSKIRHETRYKKDATRGANDEVKHGIEMVEK